MAKGNVKYQVMRRQDLNKGQLDAISYLKDESLSCDYPNTTPEERRVFIANSNKSLIKPNSSIGLPFTGRRQAYARPLSVIATQNGMPIVHLAIADNASSRDESKIKKEVVIQAKLRLKEFKDIPFIRSRYAWLGYAAIGPDVRDQIATDTDTVNPLDVAIALGLTLRHDLQKVSAYPWGGEDAWKKELSSVGFWSQSDVAEEIHPFGPGSGPIHQEHQVSSSVSLVQNIIIVKNGAEKAIDNARWATGLV